MKKNLCVIFTCMFLLLSGCAESGLSGSNLSAPSGFEQTSGQLSSPSDTGSAPSSFASDESQRDDQLSFWEVPEPEISIEEIEKIVDYYDYRPCTADLNDYYYPIKLFEEMISEERKVLAQRYTMPDLTEIERISFGSFLSLKLALTDEDGKTFIWGYNTCGSIGDGTNIYRHLPYQLELEDIRLLRLGNSFTMAVTEDGALYGWGSNISSQMGLGDDRRFDFFYEPTEIPFDEPIADILIIDWNSMILTTDGDVYQAGPHIYESRDFYNIAFNVIFPEDDHVMDYKYTKMDLPEKMVSISGSSASYVMAGESGKVYLQGLLGGYDEYKRYDDLTEIPFPEKIVKVHAAYSNCIMAISESGTLYGYGFNTHYQILPDDKDQFVETPVAILNNVVKVDGGMQNIALTTEGLCYVWGLNPGGALGLGEEKYVNDFSGEEHYVKKPTLLAFPEPISDCYQSAENGVALSRSGSVYFWGRDWLNISLDPDFKHEDVKNIPFVERIGPEWTIFSPKLIGQ